MTKHVKKLSIVAAAAGLMSFSLGSAAPASASTVVYGRVQSNSHCPTSEQSSYCNVYVKYGTKVTHTTPSPTGDVNCPNTSADGLYILDAINRGLLTNKYVAVVYGGSGVGQINCH